MPSAFRSAPAPACRRTRVAQWLRQEDLWRNPLLSFTQLGSHSGPVSIAPGRFRYDASEVRVAGLGNASFSNKLAAGVFAGKCSAITHQLPCTLEAGSDVAQLSCDRDCRDVGYAAQCLQSPDHPLHGLSLTTSRMASSNRLTRALMCSNSFRQSRSVTSCAGCA
jgi:hypothetical protein